MKLGFSPGVGSTKEWRMGAILVEKHTKECTCSYCKGDHRMWYGLNIPPDWKAWNSWYVIKLPFGIYARSCVMGWFRSRL